MILRKLITWLSRQIMIFVMSTTVTALWLVGLLQLVSIAPDLYLLILIIALSSLVPALSMLEAGGRSVFRREYRMDLISCVVMAAAMIALPFTAIYLYFIGECMRCEQSYWDVAFAITIFAVPAAIFQNVSYRIGKRLISFQ